MRCLILVCLIVMSLGTGSVLSAGQQPMNIPVLSGTVQSVSADSIKINDITYRVVRKVPVYKVVATQSGGFSQQRSDYNTIYAGQPVTFRAVGNVIIELRTEGR